MTHNFASTSELSRLSLSLLLAGICRLLAAAMSQFSHDNLLYNSRFCDIAAANKRQIPASSNESDNLLNLLSGMNNCMLKNLHHKHAIIHPA
jgi:hypothetical protein